MKLAIFDLDNTLIAGDSDCLWGEYLIEIEKVDAEIYRQGHEQYYQDYLNGELDIREFLEFQLKPLADNNMQVLLEWRKDYVEKKVKPLVLAQAQVLVEQHRDQGHALLIITATNRFLTEPIAAIFNIHDLIACEPEMINGEYTGNVSGTPSYAEGKVTRLQRWLVAQPQQPEETWFYSDSHNDIPLLSQVNHPVAVDPDDLLRKQAVTNGWQIISLRD
ncbi:MAG: HAD family hydrolase [Pseudomonadota bacterium]